MSDTLQNSDRSRAESRQTFLLDVEEHPPVEKSGRRPASSRLDTLAVAELLRDELGEVRERLARIEASLELLHGMHRRESLQKEFYTTGEVASLLGKAKFTVREWCRNERINAERGISGRGVDPEWRISHAELLRVQNEGLLPKAKRL